MYKYPNNLFTDIRIEDTYSTQIVYADSKLIENKVKKEKGAFIRIFDGDRWYYSATIDIDNIQTAIDELAQMAKPNTDILNHPVIKRMQVNKDVNLRYTGDFCVKNISNKDKQLLVSSLLDIYERDEISKYNVKYLDDYRHKHIMSSLGTDVEFDFQKTQIKAFYTISVDEYPSEQVFIKGGFTYDDVLDKKDEALRALEEDIEYVKNAVPVEPGKYTCVFAPEIVGIFAHECFGHQSEADLIMGDDTREKMFTIGNKIGAEKLSIVDTGSETGTGYIVYDDEGNRCTKTYLIKDGKIAGHMHNSITAASMNEDVAGNGRAINFEFEPIPRMTTTYVEAGNETKEEVFAKVEDGIYVKDAWHGSGMQTFTIAPRVCYRIRNGKICEPLKVSVITGEVRQALMDVDGLSDKIEFDSGNCGKNEQMPLPVGMGGPYMRIKNISVN